MSQIKTSVSSFKLSSAKTLQLKINHSCPGLQRHHVNCTPQLDPASFDVSVNGITRSSNTDPSTSNNDTGLDSASWTLQQFILYLVLFHVSTDDPGKL